MMERVPWAGATANAEANVESLAKWIAHCDSEGLTDIATKKRYELKGALEMMELFRPRIARELMQRYHELLGEMWA